MFDTTKNYDYSSYETVVNIKPACVGTIQKSSPLSRIVKCAVNSDFAKAAMDEFSPHITKKVAHGSGWRDTWYSDEPVPIIVLQVMVFGDNQCLIEFITEEDFNKSKEVKEE